MKLFLDLDGKVNYDKIDKTTTVKDMLKAIDIFLDTNPLPCSSCQESCCKKSWSVEMDNVSVNRLSCWENDKALEFVKVNLVRKKNYYREFYQYVLKKDKDCRFITKDNFCTIYNERPVICRLYICIDKSYRYNVVRELIGSTYLKALVIEDKMRRSELAEKTLTKYNRNPALFAKDYDLHIEDIFNYAEEEGWLYCEDRRELY